MKRFLLCTGFIVSASGVAQDSTHIRSGMHVRTMPCSSAQTDTFALVQASSGAAPRTAARVAVTIARRTLEGVDRCLMIQRYVREGPAAVDSSVVDAATLVPVTYFADLGVVRHDVTFSQTHASLRVDSGGIVTAERISLPAGSFSAVAEPLLFRTLPIALGRVITYDAFNAPRRVTRVRLRVVALDTITVGSVAVGAWRMQYDAGAAPTTIWLALGSQRPLRYMTDLGQGRTFWRLRDGDAPHL